MQPEKKIPVEKVGQGGAGQRHCECLPADRLLAAKHSVPDLKIPRPQKPEQSRQHDKEEDRYDMFFTFSEHDLKISAPDSITQEFIVISFTRLLKCPVSESMKYIYD